MDADGTAAEVLDELAAAANGLPGGHRPDWVVAVPGPFDYEQGIGLFRDVGKFDSLYGVDVRHGLLTRIRPAPDTIRFLNDADAFGVGEYAAGAARGHDRAVCITLGTGVGSAFLDRGRAGERRTDGAAGRQHPSRRPRRAAAGGDGLPAGDPDRVRRGGRSVRRTGARRARHRRTVPAG